MPRAPRDHRLETREARGRLKARPDPYWRQLHEGLFLGYRKGTAGGSWYVRTYDGGRYRKQKLALADDHADADGVAVLSYRQATRKALEGVAPERVHGYTVGDALDDYLAEIETRTRSADETRNKAETRIRPNMGAVAVDSLTPARIRSWLNDLAKPKEKAEDGDVDNESVKVDPDAKRKRQATANRILTVLKAALNQAYRDGKVDSDSAWRRVQPFRDADQPKIRFLSHDEARRLVNAADAEFRPLVRAALLTGARYGELIRMTAGDYDPDSKTVRVKYSKTGQGRHVYLTDEGVSLFDSVTAGKKRGELVFIRTDGEPWGRAHQTRRMKDACKRAGIDPPAGFHVLRHTYGSLLAQQGVPLQVIAHALGHADTRMTQRHYAHLQPDHVANAVRAALPDFGGDDNNVRPLRKPKKQPSQ